MTSTEHLESQQSWFVKAAGWLITFLVPVILVLLTIRLLINPWYPEFEYRTPGFPEDRYGLTFEERLYWSKISIDYLVNDAGIEYLANLRFPDGQFVPQPSCGLIDDCSRVYNDRELQHMVDVKKVVGVALWVLWISLGVFVLLGLFAWRGGWLDQYWQAVGRGGWLTLVLTGAIILFVLIAFGVIFVWFHEIFFQPGTWTFYFSDTLIRLFPERFWRDTFLIVAGLPALIGAVLGYFLGRKKRAAT